MIAHALVAHVVPATEPGEWYLEVSHHRTNTSQSARVDPGQGKTNRQTDKQSWLEAGDAPLHEGITGACAIH